MDAWKLTRVPHLSPSFGEGVTRSCHPERGRAPIRFLQDGKPESKDLGFVLQSQGAPPFAVLWRRVGSSLCGADALVRVLRNRSVWRGRPRQRAKKQQPLPLAPPQGA